MLISTQNEGPRSYVPAGSHVGRVYSLGNYAAAPAVETGVAQSTVLRDVLISTVTAVVTQFALNYFFSKK